RARHGAARVAGARRTAGPARRRLGDSLALHGSGAHRRGAQRRQPRSCRFVGYFTLSRLATGAGTMVVTSPPNRATSRISFEARKELLDADGMNRVSTPE